MKAIALFLMLSCASQAQTETHDIRVVNGRSVDIGSLHDWYLKPNGERPLKHWKKLNVLQLNGAFSGWDRYSLKTEDGQLLDALMEHMPQEIKNYFNEVASKRVAIVQFRAQIEREDDDVRRRDAITPISASGDPSYVNAVMAKRDKVNLDAIAVRKKQDALQKMEGEFESLRSQVDTMIIFAMNSGRQWAGVGIWDCGVQKR